MALGGKKLSVGKALILNKPNSVFLERAFLCMMAKLWGLFCVWLYMNTKPLRIKKLLWVVVFLMLFFSCSLFPGRLNVNEGGPVAGSYHSSIPFDYTRDKVIVPLKIGGAERRFIFDTGAITMISQSLYRKMDYPVIGKGSFYDIHQNVDTARVVSIPRLQFGEVVFRDVPAIVYDLNRIPWSCFQVDGIIGSNMMRHSAVQIDLGKKRLTISDNPDNLDIREAGRAKMKLDKQSSPHIRLKFSENQEDYVLFDSGSDGFVNLNRSFFERMEDDLPLYMERKGRGSNVMGMIGAGSDDQVWRFMLDSFSIAGHSFLEPEIEVTQTRSKVGSQLFGYGKVTLDYPSASFYFEANKDTLHYRDDNGAGYGFIPVVKNDTFRVGLVWENSLVDSLGLKPGYRILRINEYHFADSLESAFCRSFLNDAFKTTPEIEMIYQDEKGDYKRVKIRRKK